MDKKNITKEQKLRNTIYNFLDTEVGDGIIAHFFSDKFLSLSGSSFCFDTTEDETNSVLILSKNNVRIGAFHHYNDIDNDKPQNFRVMMNRDLVSFVSNFFKVNFNVMHEYVLDWFYDRNNLKNNQELKCFLENLKTNNGNI